MEPKDEHGRDKAGGAGLGDPRFRMQLLYRGSHRPSPAAQEAGFVLGPEG